MAVVDYKLGDETGTAAIRDILAVESAGDADHGHGLRQHRAGRRGPPQRGPTTTSSSPSISRSSSSSSSGRAERQKLRQEISLLQERLEEKLSARNFVFASPLDGGCRPARRQGRAERGDGPHHGRDRNGQGSRGPDDPPGLVPQERPLPRAQRHLSAGDAHRGRALRRRERRLHGGPRAQDRQVRGRRGRHDPPRRDRRPRARGPGQAPALPPGPGVLPARLEPAAPGRRPGHRRDQPGPRRPEEAGEVPGRPLLPPRTSSPSPSRRSASRKEDIPLLVDFFLKKYAAREGKKIHGHHPGGAGRPDQPRLPRQRPRARERRRAGRGVRREGRPRRRRPAGRLRGERRRRTREAGPMR
ncbi:MAG: hypothetical protein MZU79_05230 [Anaerotruncus sp.]|nr:hypothetical protein [Anaerotruncus sp.]